MYRNMVITELSITDDIAEEPKGIMEQERAFLNALKNSATFQVEGNILGGVSDKGDHRFTTLCSCCETK